MGGARDRRYGALISILLVLATLVAFGRVLGNEFIKEYDDGDYVATNLNVQTGLSAKSVHWAFTTFHAANWHPLTWISHMLDWQIYKSNPAGHHATSLLIHIANVLLLFFVLSRMTGAVWRSAFVAGLFAVHPLHVESVAWAAERKDVLSTFFWFLAMLTYFLYTERPGILRYLLVFAALALGLMAKPMLVTLPLVLLLLDYWPLGRMRFGKNNIGGRALSTLVLEKVPLLILVVGSCIITYLAQRGTSAVGTLEQFGIGERATNAAVSYIAYIVKTVWPSNLAVFYPHPEATLPVAEVIGAVLLLIILTVFAIREGARRRYLTVGWLWYVITLVPVIGLVQVGSQALADRYTYVTLTGLFIIIAWGVPDLLARKVKPQQTVGRRDKKGKPRAGEVKEPEHMRPALVIPATAVLAILMTCTWFQVGYWHDTNTLFAHAMRAVPDNYVAYTVLGEKLRRENKLDQAERLLSEAVRVAQTHIPAQVALGCVLTQRGDYARAMEHCRAALDINPNDASALSNFGVLLARQKRFDEAVRTFKKALSLKPGDAACHNNLCVALTSLGKFDEAIDHGRQAIRLMPRYADAHYSLALALARRGKPDEAVEEFERLLRIDPNRVVGYSNLAITLVGQGKLDQAIEQWKNLLGVKPDDAETHANLARAYTSKGDYAKAWREIHLCRQYGGVPDPQLVAYLSQKMPER